MLRSLNPFVLIIFMGFSLNIYALDQSKPLNENLHHIWQTGLQLHKEGKYQQAIEHYDKVLTAQPDSFRAWHNKGVALLALDDPNSALPCLSKALSIKPHYTPALNMRGFVYITKARYQEAIVDLQKSIEVDKHNPKTHYNLGTAWLFTENYKKALLSYQFAVRINSKPQELWYRIAYAFSRLERYEDALEALEKAFALQPVYYEIPIADFWFEKGYALHNLHRFVEAEQCYIKTLELDRSWNVAHYNLACIYTMQKQWSKAFNALDLYYEITSEDPSEIYQDDELQGLVKHPLYKDKIKRLLEEKSNKDK